MEVRPGL